MTPAVQKKKAIALNINTEDDEFSEDDPTHEKQMSPAFKNNNNFEKAALKMPGPGNETKWPRRDNAFMAKQSLSY